MIWRALALVCLFGVEICEAKTRKGQVTVGGQREEHRWKYVSKFGYAVGRGTYSIRLKAIRPQVERERKVELDVYLDEKWEDVETIKKNCEKSAMRNVKHEVSLPTKGEWSEWINGTLRQTMRPHVWYFAVADCGESKLLSATRIRYEFMAWQEDGTEFSVEQDTVLLMHLAEVCLLAAFSFFYITLCKKYMESAENLHATIWALSIAGAVLFLGKIFGTIHWTYYNSDGEGIKALDVIADICVMLSQVTLASLLITVAHGYTLLPGKNEDLDIIVLMVFMIGVIHVLLAGFGKITDDAAHKWHEYEGPVGWVIIACRMALALWFSLALKWTWEASGAKLKVFLFKFGFISMVYFFSYPVLFCITGFFAPYVRQKVVSLGQFLIHWLSLILLTRMFLSRGEYFQVSTMNSSFLPGGGISVLDKDE
eukprot:CAMPEP_0204394586 /NCGR_PEP_ID=MMETSP0469-20131031/62911_1 /ASSEMBLY_ACC=CAM_ASM_000384 /TAXON_ID=2969 /ORGANISM="Oxyrrhis marina" /LENGTH=424 /DNA_ID=CAMNT_0051388695 /DNA_START=15 /DNA_END=1289 /DNA_ORIENTATION=-